MAVSWDSRGPDGEVGRNRGQLGGMYNGKFEGEKKDLPDTSMPALPPSVNPGGHGGSHGHLTEDFIGAILQNRQPLVDISMSLNMSVAER